MFISFKKLFLFCILLGLFFQIKSSIPDYETSNKSPNPKEYSRYDYAAAESWGKIVGTSQKIYGARGILTKGREKYLLVPCEVPEKWIEITIVEDILIDEIEFTQGEMYSSPFKNIEILYSTENPTGDWIPLLTVTLLPVTYPQKFKVKGVWTRFLKLVFQSYYGDEHYCTLTQFSVYGSNVLQNLNEDYETKSQEVRDTLNKIISFERNRGDYDGNFISAINQLRNIEHKTYEFPLGDDVCFEEYFFEFNSDEKPGQVVVFQEKNLRPSKKDVLKAMVHHMAKTEVKLELLDRYINLFIDTFEQNAVKMNLIKNRLKKLEKHFKDERYKHRQEIKELENKISQIEDKVDKLNAYLTEIQNFSLSNEKNLKIMQFISLIFVILAAAGVLLVKFFSPKKIDLPESPAKAKKTKIKRISTKSSNCTSDEEKFIHSVTRLKSKKKN
jgi:uncharacterized protein YlxW (UPF0749 family)